MPPFDFDVAATPDGIVVVVLPLDVVVDAAHVIVAVAYRPGRGSVGVGGGLRRQRP
jgi:hypothetical protein